MGGEVPHSAYRMNFLNKETSILGHLHADLGKDQPKPRQQLQVFEIRLMRVYLILQTNITSCNTKTLGQAWH
jgi:hypothetical protein